MKWDAIQSVIALTQSLLNSRQTRASANYVLPHNALIWNSVTTTPYYIEEKSIIAVTLSLDKEITVTLPNGVSLTAAPPTLDHLRSDLEISTYLQNNILKIIKLSGFILS